MAGIQSPHRVFTVKAAPKGPDVRRIQKAVGTKQDGEYGPVTAAAAKERARRRGVKASTLRHGLTIGAQRLILGLDKPTKRQARRAERYVRRRPLRVKALEQARHLIGVMEQGGNNVGPTVTKIIRANGGEGPEPWCGDFVAYCYRLAGSKAVTRWWASVYYLGVISGLRTVRVPQPGDVVRFTFDHTGLFEKDNGDGTITTIEGNTGSIGAVSDSSTGGDGVYRKIRSKSQVANYRRVLR